MAKIYTDRGKTWEIANSWWILLTFAPFGIMSFIAFLYTGSKVKNQRWRVYGFVYLAVLMIAFTIAATGIGAAVALTLWIVTIIHAFKIRPAYLVQLDVLKSNNQEMTNQEISKLREEAEAKFKVNRQAKNQPPQPKIKNEQVSVSKPQGQVLPPKAEESVPFEKEVRKIDINTAAESEIAAIPAIGIILAKKVVKKRQDLGGFQSFEQFSEVMELKGHTIEKVKQSVTFSMVEETNVSMSGRMIDF
ncbi:helix-hairpin-helix domain-containing protein [Bacillus cereus]|uniref:helix-hairpin-helix domain-containing protein n=1 Tax=Bacillus cereus TaxID=1396 RepID=UPI0015D4A1EE|nr:helix-hairpin-helix domain-containing protein [Bacillus cereus]